MLVPSVLVSSVLMPYCFTSVLVRLCWYVIVLLHCLLVYVGVLLFRRFVIIQMESVIHVTKITFYDSRLFSHFVCLKLGKEQRILYR